MKRLLLLTSLIIVCFTSNSWAALGAATVWECRTTGASTGGGGFNSGVAVPGTDYSQQDAAQDSGTDLACADGDAAAPVITSATHDFVAADEGNIINITEAGTGFTLGRYLIVDTNANAATLDRACGADGALTGGDWYLGGAVDSPITIVTTVVAGNKIWIKNGTYVGKLSLSISGTSASPIIWEGYNTDRGDASLDNNRPLIDANSANTNAVYVTCDANLFKFMRFANATSATVKLENGASYACYFYGCKFSSSPAALQCYAGDCLAVNCEFNLHTTFCISILGGRLVNLYSCYIHDNTGGGLIAAVSSYGQITNCIFDTNTGDNVMPDRGYILSCIAYNNTGAGTDGFLQTGNPPYSNFGAAYYNCISQDNGQYGFNGNSTFCLFDYNCYNGNGTAGLNNITAGANDVTADPSFTNAAGGDFTLGAASPCLNTGFPSAMPGATGDYEWNIGVDQDDNDAAAGGGGGLFISVED